ncbi:hypothetical protein EV356DRAFT_502863 [Viridothelium virens]|uniref:Dynactin subunit 6 n=1 Tax=Viridothelium virens TaxID=1048519 RepID=A0A6A6H7K8_VIRVR|nr:hypothetical protein EV356DRAFT_502863 [Viridothelium virens]
MSDQVSSNRDSATFKVVPAAATVAAAPSKRVSSTASKPALSKPPTTIHPSAIVAEKAVLTGLYHISIGANSVIHPFARIVSEAGPITIGENVIVNERAVVGGARSSDGMERTGDGNVEVHIGNSVTVESSAVVEANMIGEGSIIDIEARVGTGARIGKYCKLSPKASVGANETMEDFTTLSDPGRRHTDHLLKCNPTVRALRSKRQKDQVELLRRLIPSNLAKWS